MYPGYGAPGFPQQGYQQTTTVQTGYPQPVYPQQGYQQTTTTQFVQVPQSYTRVQYNYSSPYCRQSAYMVPYGVDPQTAALMNQASAIFRQFDRNYSGQLDFKEWKRAMKALNYYMSKHDKARLFQMVDRDYSGRISEREFVEYWVYSRAGGGGGYGGAPAMGYGGAPGYGAPPMGYGAPGYGAPGMPPMGY